VDIEHQHAGSPTSRDGGSSEIKNPAEVIVVSSCDVIGCQSEVTQALLEPVQMMMECIGHVLRIFLFPFHSRIFIQF